MERRLYLTTATGVLLLAGIGALSVTARGDIQNSKHNFSAFGWAQNQVCLPCHTPHHTMDTSDMGTGLGAGKLWNHDLPAVGQTYTLYGSGGVKVRNEALDPHSILCMGCHDGTVALDSYGGNVGNTFITGPALLGTDLRDDHPVGATAVYRLSGGWGYHPYESWERKFGSGFLLKPMMIDNEQKLVVSCTTCHEPHNRGGHPKMVWGGYENSELCLACHNK